MKNLTILFMFFFNLFFTFCGCSNKENKKNIEPLILTKKNNTYSALKLNGIYILTFNVPFNLEFYGVVENSFILYNNGQVIILGGGGSTSEFIQKKQNRLKTNNGRIPEVYNYIDSYGLYEINNQQINIEYWGTSSDGFSSNTYYPAYGIVGKILNDTTFQIYKSYQIKSGQKINFSDMDATYHFYDFSPKPDSNNNFIP